MNLLSNAVVVASKEVYRKKRIILEEKAHEPIPMGLVDEDEGSPPQGGC